MSHRSFTPFVLEPSWQHQLQEELQEPYIANLAAFIEKEYATAPVPIYPPKELIFNAFLSNPF